MGYSELVTELKMHDTVFAITRVNIAAQQTDTVVCVYQAFGKVQENKPFYCTKESVTCPGSRTGLGFYDGFPDIPGGIGQFISCGNGKGFPAGERIKCSPEIAEDMLLRQPKNVLGDFNALKIERYHPEIAADIVTMLATADQLSALLHLFYFRKSSYDDVIVPIVSGCAQIARIPYGEIGKPAPKAVMGNLDIFSRPHLQEGLISLTVPHSVFSMMCEDTKDCFFHAPIWNGIKKRL